MATTFDDLPEADRTRFRERLKVYGLDESDVNYSELIVPGGSTVSLAAGDPGSAVPARMLTTTDLDELKRWIGIPNDLYTGKVLDQSRIPMPVMLREREVEGTAEPGFDQMANVELAASAYLFGDSTAVAGYKGDIEDVFSEFKIPIWLFTSITVYPGATLHIGKGQNVLCAWTITIYDGGTITSSGGLRTDAVNLVKAAEQQAQQATPGNSTVVTSSGGKKIHD